MNRRHCSCQNLYLQARSLLHPTGGPPHQPPTAKLGHLRSQGFVLGRRGCSQLQADTEAAKLTGLWLIASVSCRLANRYVALPGSADCDSVIQCTDMWQPGFLQVQSIMDLSLFKQVLKVTRTGSNPLPPGLQVAHARQPLCSWHVKLCCQPYPLARSGDRLLAESPAPYGHGKHLHGVQPTN